LAYATLPVGRPLLIAKMPDNRIADAGTNPVEAYMIVQKAPSPSQGAKYVAMFVANKIIDAIINKTPTTVTFVREEFTRLVSDETPAFTTNVCVAVYAGGVYDTEPYCGDSVCGGT